LNPGTFPTPLNAGSERRIKPPLSPKVLIGHGRVTGAAVNVLKKTDGKYPGPLEFIKTMTSVKLDAVRGPVSLDDRRTAINNIYIKKVEKKIFGSEKEEPWNTVIKTYPNVSQFWTYDKAGFLKQPLYSRDFPPCRFYEWLEE